MYPMIMVDIVIPVFNQHSFTEATLTSLYKYTNPSNFHLIVIDNHSTDGVTDYLKQFKKSHSNMDLICSDENLGWCKGLNAGFKVLTQDGDFVLWANNDILFEPEWLEKMVKHFKGGVGAVGPTSNYVAGRQHVRYNHGHKEEVAPALIGFCLMFRREVINLVGDVDVRFGLGGADEYDYILRMKKELGFGCMIARDVYIHHFGSKSLMELPEICNDQDKYLDYCRIKDEQLDQKWTPEVTSKYLGYPLNGGILMCTPNPGFIKTKFWKDTMMMFKPPGLEITELTMEPNIVDFERPSDIADARNALCIHAIKQGFKEVLFVDSDMRIPREAIFKLTDMNAPVVAGYFFARNEPHFPCAFQWSKEGDGYVSIYAPNTGVVDADAVGMAFTKIKLDWLEKVPQPWFHKDKFGEDIEFCRKLKEVGGRILVDTDLIIRHIGAEKEIGPEDYKP